MTFGFKGGGGGGMGTCSPALGGKRVHVRRSWNWNSLENLANETHQKLEFGLKSTISVEKKAYQKHP